MTDVSAWRDWYAHASAKHRAEVEAREQAAREARKQRPRRRPVPYCYLAVCRLCGVEVYRHGGIRRRTRKLLETVEQERRWGWLKHAQLAGHHQRRYQVRTWKGEVDPEANILDHLTQVIWLNETCHHPDLEVGTGEVLPEHLQVTHVMRLLGISITQGDLRT